MSEPTCPSTGYPTCPTLTLRESSDLRSTGNGNLLARLEVKAYKSTGDALRKIRHGTSIMDSAHQRQDISAVKFKQSIDNFSVQQDGKTMTYGQLHSLPFPFALPAAPVGIGLLDFTT